MRRRWTATFVLLLPLFVLRPLAADDEDDPPAAITQEQYQSILGRVLDGMIARLRPLPRQPLRFSANLWYAHAACIEGIPLETLTAMIDALKDAGAARLDVNVGLHPWLEGRQDLIDKYDAVFRHIRDAGLGLELNPTYLAGRPAVKEFADWRDAALRVYPELARRYRPEILTVVHEPTTQTMRMGFKVSPAEWRDFVQATAKAVREAAPATRIGAGVLHYEAEYFEAFLPLRELDCLSFDVYSLKGMKTYTRMIEQARKQGKAVYMEETWRPPYYVKPAGKSDNLDQVMAVGVGSKDFQALDARWLEAMTLYAGVLGLETVTPFWTPTFFHYDDDGGNAFAREYNLHVIEAVKKGERTPMYEAFRKLVREYGAPAATAEWPRITTLRENGGRVDWTAANGGKIAYDRRGEDGYFDVCVMNPDGSGETCLTEDAPGLPQKHNGNPAWHPSGQYLVIQSEKPQVPRIADAKATPGAGVLNDLWVITADGKRCWKVRDLRFEVSQDSPGTLHAHFSHDGRRLLWSERLKDNGRPFGEWALMLGDFALTDAGPALTNVRTVQPGNRSAFYESHGFSPDDARILFTSNQDEGLDIYEMELATGQVKRLTRTPAVWDEHAQYSPDGRSILWMSSEGFDILKRPFRLKAEYWMMDADGSHPRQVTWFNTPGHRQYRGKEFVVAADGAWSPDGTRFAGFLIDQDPAGNLNDQGSLVMIELGGK